MKHLPTSKLSYLSLSPVSDACRPAQGSDALFIWRALSERSELVRSPSCVRPIECGRTGRQWFWVLLPNQKGLGCRAETRHLSYIQIIPVSGIVRPNTAEIIWKDYNNSTMTPNRSTRLGNHSNRWHQKKAPNTFFSRPYQSRYFRTAGSPKMMGKRTGDTQSIQCKIAHL